GGRLPADRCTGRPDAAGTATEVTLFASHVRVPDLVIIGSHCTGLYLVTAPQARAGVTVRSIAVGSPAGWRRQSAANAIWRRSTCSTRNENLQYTVSWPGARTGAGLAADAGRRLSKGRRAFRRTARAGGRARCALRCHHASWSTATRARALAS